jgi:hypothetical protein
LKKEQKTFAPLVPWRNSVWAAYAKEQELFASFFQKRSLTSLKIMAKQANPWRADPRVACQGREKPRPAAGRRCGTAGANVSP